MTPSPNLIDRLQSWLQTSYGMRRPPTTAAGVLALIVELHKDHTPFPTREHVADLLRCSKFGVDAAINQAIARGLITQKTETSDGNIQRRESVIRHRYYVPSSERMLAAGEPHRNHDKVA